MDIINVSVESIKPLEKIKAFPSIWCSRKACGNAVDASTARWEIPTAEEPTVVVVGIYCDALDDDGMRVTHTLGTVKIDASKAPNIKWYTVYDSSHQPPIRTGRVRVMVESTLHTPVAYDLPLKSLRRAAEKNLQHIAPYGHSAALQACAPHLERIHAPYYRSSSGVMMPSGAFLLSDIVVEDEEALVASMTSRLNTVLRRYGMTEEAFVADVRANKKHIDRRLLQIMSETLSYATLHKVHYASDTQMGKSTDRWETVRLPGSFVGDCEDCAKDLVLECMEWPKHCDMTGSRGIDAVANLLSLYVPVMVQGAVGSYKHTKDVSATGSSFLNHEWAALHPRVWFEHVTGIKASSRVAKIHKDLPTIVMEGTGEVYPFHPPLHDTTFSRHIESMHEWVGADTTYRFYNYPVTCSSPFYADRGILDFVYTSNNMYGAPFNDWIQRKHGIIVACQHKQSTMNAFRQALSVERPIRAYTDIVNTLRAPRNVLQNPIRVGYVCNDNADNIHKHACETAEKLRDEGITVEAQISTFDSRYVCEWYFQQNNT